MNLKKAISAAIGLMIFIAATAAVIYTSPSSKTAPDITLQVIDGRTINPTDFKGIPTLITFWATSCSSCIQEMPHLVELYKDFNAEGFEIIAIAMTYDPPNRVVEFTQSKDLPYAVVLDLEGRAAKAFGGVDVTPTSLLISPEGNIINRQKGKIDIEALRESIKKMQPTTNTTYS